MEIHEGPAEAHEVSQRILHDAAWRGECAVSVARAVFCVLGLTRFLAINDSARWSLAFPYLLGVICSTIVLGHRRTSPNVAFLYGSVVLDWALSFLALLPDVLWPPLDYTGVANRPDLAVVYLLVVAASFRLQPAACWLATALHLLSCGALMALDGDLRGADWGQRGAGASMILLLTLGSGLLAYQLAIRTRRLVLAGAIETWRNIQAQRTLAMLAEEGHDARSLLSAARLDADQLLERLTSGSKRGAIEMAQQLREQISHVVALASRSRDRSFVELARLEQIDLRSLPTLTARVASIVGARYPHVMIELGGELRRGSAVLLGGALAFERVLLNLLTNACEGDGTSSASRVYVQFLDSSGAVSLIVEDDGPGFRQELLQREPNCITTKPYGSGLGLYLVARLTEASGGELERCNRQGHGARVTVKWRKVARAFIRTEPTGETEVLPGAAAGVRRR